MTLALVPRRDENMEIVLPADADGINMQPGLSWAWSAWIQVTAGVAYPFLLCGLYWYRLGYIAAGAGNVHNGLAVEIGAGAAGSEATIAQAQDGLFLGTNSTDGLTFISQVDTWLFCPITVPPSTRIAIRAAQSHSAVVMRARGYLTGYNLNTYSTPLWLPQRFPEVDRYLKALSPSMPIATPILAPVALTSGGSAWAYGSWTELLASLSRDTLITGLGFCNTTTSSRNIQAKIGIGAAGGEVAMSKVALPGGTIGLPSGSGKCLLFRPLFARAGERVAVQIASNFAGAPTSVWLLGYEMK